MGNKVGLLTNFGKTVEIVCHPCQEADTQSESAYERRMAGLGLSHQERQRFRVKYSECEEEMTMG